MPDGGLRYAKSGDAHLAYRVWGSINPTIVMTMGIVVATVDTVDQPASPYLSTLEALSAQRRVLLCERRGHGLSDPVTRLTSLDERVADLHAVLDAADVEQAVLVGVGEGGPVAVTFATTHPERVASLVLGFTAARFTQDPPDFPWGFTDAQIQSQLNDIDENWGEGAMTELYFGSAAETPGVREEFGRLQRAICSRAQAHLMWQADMMSDVRTLLPRIAIPTLVMARPGDRFVAFDASAALAAAIPGAQLRTLPPGDHHGLDVADVSTSELLNFIGAAPTTDTVERELVAVLFTDIVGSTEMLSAQGDSHWRHQLDMHDAIVDNTLAKYDGRRAKHTGDGVFAVFTGPSRAVRCGLELVTALGTRGIPIRVGLHVGECERRGEEWSGLAVHVGARIGALAGPGEVLTSRTVRDLCAGSGLAFDDIGPHRFKGLAEDVSVYRVRGDARHSKR